MNRTGAAPGLTLATVSQTDDPKGMGRIKVLFFLSGQHVESDWTPLMSGFAGPDTGAFFLPKAGDLALVGFGDADPNQPYVLGFLWDGKIKPPVEQAKQQDVRVIRTRQGKLISLDDSGSGGITITDEKQNRVVIDTANNAVSVESRGDLTVSAVGTLTIKAAQVVVQNTGGSAKLTLSDAGAQLNGGSSIKLSAAMIDLN